MAKALKIILADDDPVSLGTLQEILEAADHTVLTAKDTTGASAELEKEIPDLLVLDLQMPGGGGELVTAKVGTKVPPNIPIIFVTGLSPAVVKSRVPDMPHIRVLYKPIGAQALYDAIGKVVPGAK